VSEVVMRNVLITGFPGFLGSFLIDRILARDGGSTVVCLVQPLHMSEALRRVEAIDGSERIRLVGGDITRPGLGAAPGDLPGDLHEIYHLAAVYDLSVEPGLAHRVNVDGVRHVLEVAAASTVLERLHHVSTCYVSGDHAGVFRETDLDVGQGFHNHYEETKFLGERLVHDAMAGGLPATVYRPAITVGDSTTGATLKYDGPYYVFRWVLRRGTTVVLPVVGDGRSRVNLVPSDFVIGALDHLSASLDTAGRVFHLADPAPLTVNGIIEEVGRVLRKRIVKVRLTPGIARFAIERIPGVDRVLGIPAALLPYFDHPAHYDTAGTSAALEGSGVACPPLPTYLPRLLEYLEAHPGVRSVAMV
jgi:nucleoside-diphosphate-sugar epimerase